MTAGTAGRLLADDEPTPVLLHRPHGAAPFLITCDHAGRRIPRRLGTLGLSDAERQRHIGWDIGAWAVSTLLADALDAAAIGQAYSRLVIDCNRAPHWPSAVPAVSESTPIPGNTGLDDLARAARVAEIHAPYHAAVAAMVHARLAGGAPFMYVAMHSFTPIYKGVARPWHAGVLFDGPDPLSAAMLDLLRGEPDLVVGANQPYVLSSSADYSVPVHAQANAVAYLELEIRQDLIADTAGQQTWAARLARLLPQAWQRRTG